MPFNQHPYSNDHGIYFLHANLHSCHPLTILSHYFKSSMVAEKAHIKMEVKNK